MPFVFPPYSSPRGTTPTPPPRRCAMSDAPSTTAVSPTTIGSCAPCCWMRKAGSCSPTWYGCWAVTWAVGRRRRCVTRRRGRWRRRNSASACSPSAMRWSGIWTPISGGSPGSMTNATGHARTAWSASPGSTLCSGSQRLARHGVCAVGSAARCCHACAASPAPTPRPARRAALENRRDRHPALARQDLDPPLRLPPTPRQPTPADPGLTPVIRPERSQGL